MISGSESQRFLPRKSLMVKRPKRIGREASKPEDRVTVPSSSAIALVTSLKVEPGSYTP
jgi:hypothetical protein